MRGWEWILLFLSCLKPNPEGPRESCSGTSRGKRGMIWWVGRERVRVGSWGLQPWWTELRGRRVCEYSLRVPEKTGAEPETFKARNTNLEEPSFGTPQESDYMPEIGTGHWFVYLPPWGEKRIPRPLLFLLAVQSFKSAPGHLCGQDEGEGNRLEVLRAVKPFHPCPRCFRQAPQRGPSPRHI